MKTTVSVYDLQKDLHESFSYEAIQILFNYFEELEDSCGQQIEYDPVAIRCDFAEMTISEVIDAYEYLMDESRLDDDDGYQYLMNFLQDRTQVCGDTSQGTIVFQQF